MDTLDARAIHIGSTSDITRALNTVPSEVSSDFGFDPESTADREGDAPQQRDHRLE